MEFDFEVLLVTVRQLRGRVAYGVGNFQDGPDMNDQIWKLFNLQCDPAVASLIRAVSCIRFNP